MKLHCDVAVLLNLRCLIEAANLTLTRTVLAVSVLLGGRRKSIAKCY